MKGHFLGSVVYVAAEGNTATITRWLLIDGQQRITYLTIEQIKRLIKCAKEDQNPQVYPFIVIGLGTSMRRMEILTIRRENVNLPRRTIYIPQAKAGAREQTITQQLAEFLEGYMAAMDKLEERYREKVA